MPTDHARVVRGGAFNNNRRNARCAYRNRNNPDNRNDNLGFRVVVSTFFSQPEMRRALPLRQDSSPRRKNGRAYSWPCLYRDSRNLTDSESLDRGQANNNSPAPWVHPWRGAPAHPDVYSTLLLGQSPPGLPAGQ
jgi:hypothetical protein